MSRKSVCRTCLAINNRMYDLNTNNMQDIFEKLTNIKLVADDGRSGVCYICYSQLQKCQRFICMSQDADKMFRQALAKEIEIPMSGRPLNNFIVTPIDCMTIPDRALETLVTVKIEPTDIKEEVIEFDSGLFDAVKIEGIITDDFINVDEKAEITVEETDTEKYKIKQVDALNKKYQTKHSKNSAFICKECNKEFNQYDSLKRHMNNHDDTIYACNFCDETFTSKTIFQNHIRKHTKPYACTICDKSFSELSTLKKHTASHSSNKPFICGTCNKSFTHKTFLVVHLRTHTGEKPYACDICDKTFAQIGHLISHKRSHLKIKPFPCLQCDKSFSERNTLKKHVQKLHNALKPYACKICYWTFSAEDALERHQRNHLVRSTAQVGEKPVCNQCGKEFSTVGNMRKHMKTHESEISVLES